jgi:hypothetical protein
MSNKRYLKKIEGIDKPIPVKNKPVIGELPSLYRGRDININGIWHRNDGKDILRDTDPFEDGSLFEKFIFDGNIDGICGKYSLGIKDVEGMREHSYKQDTEFDKKTLQFDGGNIGLHWTDISREAVKGLASFTLSFGFTYNEQYKYSRLYDMYGVSSAGGGSNRVNAYFDIRYDRNNTKQKQYIRMCLADGSISNRHYLYEIPIDIKNGEYCSLQVVFTNGMKHDIETNVQIYLNGKMIFETGIKYISYNWTDSSDYLSGLFSHVGHNTSGNEFGTVMFTVPNFHYFEIYSKALNEEECRTLYNQETLNLVPYENPIMYLNEHGRLMEFEIGLDGLPVGEPKYLEFYPELQVNSLQAKTIKADEIIVPNGVRRVIQNTAYKVVTVSANDLYLPLNEVDIEMDTEKYDYIIIGYNQLQSTSTSNGGGNTNITLNGITEVTQGHINHNSDSVIYNRVTTITPKIVNGYKGTVRVKLSIGRYDGTTNTVSNYDNGGANSLNDIRHSPYGDDKSDLTIFEIYKGDK